MNRPLASSAEPAPTARTELAQFLRSRRARLRPAEAGLPASGRRRTPGLRREEVARLAEVGVSWYTWLEQGRDIHVSEPLLERLARALQLTPTERAHLFALAHGRPAARPTRAPTEVSAALRRMIDAHPFPAWVATARRDFLAWNRPAALIYGDFGLLPPAERNGLWLLFMDRTLRAKTPSWQLQARAAVAGFRVDAALAADRTDFDALVTSLARVSPEFRALWREHDVAERPEGSKVVVIPSVGPIEFEHITLAHAEPNGQTLRVLLSVPTPGVSLTRARKLFRAVRS